jgi:hypothetical protein
MVKKYIVCDICGQSTGIQCIYPLVIERFIMLNDVCLACIFKNKSKNSYQNIQNIKKN